MSGNHQLLEIVNVKDTQQKIGPELLQLYKFKGKKEDKENALWFLAPSLSPLRADAFVSNLLQKAFLKGSFNPQAEVYYASMIGSRKSERAHEDNGGPLYEGFPTKAYKEEGQSLNAFRKTLLRWGESFSPGCIITFSVGRPMIRHNEVPNNIVDKLCDICERPMYVFGQEPYELDEDSGVQYKQDTATSFGQWCSEREIAWIDFTLDGQYKTFEEVVQNEWKTFVGPSLKWLTEGLRFQPIEEHDPLADIEVIPALEMPPEFANL
ncbi:hypothetical protein GW915_01275 [bacterium]|nr:hypothetical protein [bacterium]